ncbi:MAG: RNA polymerase sigma factor [Solirubrobacterales bacterium]
MASKRTGQAEDDRRAAALIGRLQSGDEDAFEQLYDLYSAPIFAYLRVALHDRGDAEDATQDVFVKVLEALPEYEVRSVPFRVWLFRVARNHAINLNAKRRRSRPEDPDVLARRADLDQVRRRPEEELEDPASEVVITMMARLPPAQRQALVLHHVLGLSVSEVSSVLERSPNAVRLLERRAIARLRDLLEPRAGTQELPRGRLPLTRRQKSPRSTVVYGT